MNNIVYWIGWGFCTAIYAVFTVLQRRSYRRHTDMLMLIIAFKDLEISAGREIAKNYTKDTEALKKQIAELKADKKENN